MLTHTNSQSPYSSHFCWQLKLTQDKVIFSVFAFILILFCLSPPTQFPLRFCCALHLLLFVSSRPAVARRSGRPAPPRQPTTSAAPPSRTEPTSPEGWGSAALSTRDSSGAPGTSRAPPTPEAPPPHHCRTATARPGGRTGPQGFSASSHPSLFASE